MTGRRLAKRLIEPDVWTCPHGFPERWRPQKIQTYGPEVCDVNTDAGFEPDPQQQLALDLIFAIGPDGGPATFEFCVICCRQNLKTGLFKQTAIGWVAVLEEPDVVWSAHEMSTTREAQNELAELFRTPALNRLMLPQKNEGIYTENGEERIELRDPITGRTYTIWFKARTESGGRGLARRKLILDEAFALKPSMMGSLIPIMLAKENAQVVYGSSAGKADSSVLRDIRHRGKNRISPRLTYLEWYAPREACKVPDCTHPKDAEARKLDCALDRVELWRRANPTLSTGRITVEKIRDTRQALPADEFMRECLGWWDDPDDSGGPPAIDAQTFAALANKTAPAPTRAVLVLDVEADGSASTIGVAGATSYGDDLGAKITKTMVMYQTKAGTDWVPAAVKKLTENMDVLEVALHPSTPANVFQPALKRLGIEVFKLTVQDYGRGCVGFQAGVAGGTIVHLGQLELTANIAVARTKKSGAQRIWDSEGATVPLGPLRATSIAEQRWALAAAENPPPPPPKPVLAGASSSNRRSSSPSIRTVGF